MIFLTRYEIRYLILTACITLIRNIAIRSTCIKCLVRHVIERKLEGTIEMTGRRGRRRKQLLDDLKVKRRYWKLEEEALDRTMRRTLFGRGYRPGVRHTTE
jgi:predicted Holliday junction resolvase-like endonuclease